MCCCDGAPYKEQFCYHLLSRTRNIALTYTIFFFNKTYLRSDRAKTAATNSPFISAPVPVVVKKIVAAEIGRKTDSAIRQNIARRKNSNEGQMLYLVDFQEIKVVSLRSPYKKRNYGA